MSVVDTGRIQQAMRDEVDCEICDKVSIDAIPGIFADVQEIPEPSSFDPILTNLEDAMATLSYHAQTSNDPIAQIPRSANPNLGYVESVSDELEEWTGEAMEAYRDNIKTPFPFYVDNLYVACSTIYGAVLAEKALWKSVREDLSDLEDKAVSACEKLDDTGASTGAFTLTCVAAVVGVAGAILTAPTGGLAAPVTTPAPVPSPDPVPVTPPEVVCTEPGTSAVFAPGESVKTRPVAAAEVALDAGRDPDQALLGDAHFDELVRELLAKGGEFSRAARVAGDDLR
mgnify:CR=1 FL=1